MPITKCVCSNAWQDDRYGPGMRVVNRTRVGTVGGERCTSCGKDVIKAAPKKPKVSAKDAKKDAKAKQK